MRGQSCPFFPSLARCVTFSQLISHSFNSISSDVSSRVVYEWAKIWMTDEWDRFGWGGRSLWSCLTWVASLLHGKDIHHELSDLSLVVLFCVLSLLILLWIVYSLLQDLLFIRFRMVWHLLASFHRPTGSKKSNNYSITCDIREWKFIHNTRIWIFHAIVLSLRISCLMCNESGNCAFSSHKISITYGSTRA